LKTYITKAKTLLLLASVLAGMNLSSCGLAHGNLQSPAMLSGTSTPLTVTASPIPADTTAPVIDALDITIPYGTSLRPDEMASITDDQDESPILEIESVLDITAGNSQNPAATEGSTLSATASTASSADLYEIADIMEPAEDSATENAATEAATTGATEAAAESTTATTTDASAEAATVDPGYLFSTPGQYSVVLKGTDKSGNESTKAITVTVTDKIAPVLGGLPEAITLTDKDKNAPDYLAGITATDEIDGDLASAVTIDDSSVQYGKAGAYSVLYSVSDTSGNKTTATAPVVIRDTTPPTLAVTKSAFDLFVTDKKPDYAANVTAIDAVDGDVKGSLTVDDSSVKYKQPGQYDAKLRVEDKSGNAAEKTVKVNVTAGWKTQDGKKYYYSPQDGHLYHSWSHIDDKLYYFDPNDGHMLTGAQTIDGKQYLLDDKDGHAITGWQTIDGKKYYYSPDDGHMYHSWSNINGKDYYFDPVKGCMLTGLLTINGGQYLLDASDGHQLTGWQTISGKKYYFSPNDGHMYHDWSNIDGTEYYFDKSDGHMYTGTHYVDGEEYNFGTSGAATKVVQTRSSGSSGTTYIGNSNTGKFHYSSCSSVRQMKDKNKVYLDSRDEAINRGYVPCQRCHP